MDIDIPRRTELSPTATLAKVTEPVADDFFLFAVESHTGDDIRGYPFATLYFADDNTLQIKSQCQQTLSVQPGEVVYIPPRNFHSVEGLAPDCHCRCLYIKLDKLFNLLAPSHYSEPLKSLLFSTQVTRIRSLGRALMITNIFDEMVNSFDLAHISSIIEIIRLLSDGDHEFLLLAQSKSQRETQFSVALIQLFQQSPAARLDICSLSKRFCMSRSTFSRMVRKTMGMSFHSWLLQQKILLAQTQLHQTDVRIQDLVAQLGFSSASHFSKAFRDHTGLSPSAYREKVHCDSQNRP
ncbi:helix-turn-helix domain-containing protein [Shewanella sp. GXUN23E]|uniref:helix-turn-helix domain-containing protein n=1 Tax=Shewanella sp. GXUN23E TaxID=3422498 RepID=UPI003D7EAD6E